MHVATQISWTTKCPRNDPDDALDMPPCGRVAQVARAALTERTGSSTKGRTPNICYFVTKPSIVAIYALFEMLSQSFQ